MQKVQIQTRGHKWNGSFEIVGKEVSVSSAYGCGRAALGRRKAEAVAAELLAQAVESWASRRN